MMPLCSIALFVVSLLVSIAPVSATEVEASFRCATNSATEHTTHAEEQIFEASIAPLFVTPTSNGAQSITPLSRTLPRALRSTEQSHNISRIVNAIDSTMAATRYGLYNHKILFVSHSRHYYLYRLVRLII